MLTTSRSFFVSNDHYFHDGRLRHLEDAYGPFNWASNVVYCEKTARVLNCSIVTPKSSHPWANGLVLLDEGRTLMVNDVVHGTTTAYDVDPATKALTQRQTIALGSTPDNISEIPESGDLVVSVSPNVMQFGPRMVGEDAINYDAKVEAAVIRLVKDRNYEPELLYWDDGSLVSILTGSASSIHHRIGLAIVRQLRASSATVHALDLAPAPPKDLPSQYVHCYGSVDVTSRPDVSTTIQSIVTKAPEIHGLVNCAGVSPRPSDLIESDEAFKFTMGVNCTGTWNTTTEYMRHVLAQERSVATKPTFSIVNIGSFASLRGYASFASYVASKHAVLGLTRSWALDYAPFGVRVNLVAPGATNTPLMKAQTDDTGARGDAARAATAAIPLRRFGEPEEIATAVEFLLGDGSSYITGQVLAVNGGDQ
ncbi:short chain dehydrogenase [Stagonosporopsis vannaccii]|nr:short chain dehydrogenase [Stagonosporopsis vannaccii]